MPDVTFTSIRVTGTAQLEGTTTLPSASVGNTQIKTDTSERIAPTKITQFMTLQNGQDTGADVASETFAPAYIRKAGTLQTVIVIPDTAPTGGDKQFTVDFERAAAASGSYSTMLSSVVTVNTSSADGTSQTATLASSALTAEDRVRFKITATGSTGSQGVGVTCYAYWQEDPA